MEDAHPPADFFLILLLITLIVLSLLFSAAETAFMSVNRIRIDCLCKQKNKKAQAVGKILSKQDVFLKTVLIANNLVNVGVSSIIALFAMRLFDSGAVAIAACASSFILLVFGEITPKNIARAKPESAAFFLAPLIRAAIAIFTPIITVFQFIPDHVPRRRKDAKQSAVTEDDLKILIDVGEEEGILERNEKILMHKIFQFSDLTVKEIMTPRTDITAINITATYGEILALSERTSLSRFPVYEKDLDHIRGVLYIKDFLFLDQINESSFIIQEIIRPAFFVFETKTIVSLQSEMNAGKHNVAIALDEYGGTAGLITREDIIEEIFGAINDEYDKPAEPEFTKLNENQFIIGGGLRLQQLKEYLGVELDSEYHDTIAGYIMERSGDIPEKGTAIETAGWEFTVQSVSGNRITKVLVAKKRESEL